MTDELKLRTVPLSKLVPDPANARTHDTRNLAAISRSLELFGQRKPLVVARGNGGELVVIAGNGTLEAAKALGWDTIKIAQVPDDWDADKARAYAIADNRSAELAEWDAAALASALVDLDAVGYNATDLGFDPAEFDDGDASATDSIYTSVVNIPQYEVVGPCPHPRELWDETKADQLRGAILAADLDDDTRAFLLAAAQRHVVFNYRKVAEFYPHASAEVQRLMEDSALIIIDYDDAIRNGYARFMDTIEKLEGRDRA